MKFLPEHIEAETKWHFAYDIFKLIFLYENCFDSNLNEFVP